MIDPEDQFNMIQELYERVAALEVKLKAVQNVIKESIDDNDQFIKWCDEMEQEGIGKIWSY